MNEKNKKYSTAKEYFDSYGYYIARNVYSSSMLDEMEAEFDWIVSKLKQTGESINARWESSATSDLDGGDSEIIHTHNVHRYSATWLKAIQNINYLDVTEQIIGSDIVLHHTKLFQKPPRPRARRAARGSASASRPRRSSGWRRCWRRAPTASRTPAGWRRVSWAS